MHDFFASDRRFWFCSRFQGDKILFMRNKELEQFKTEINLTEYAAAQGYAVDRRESSRNSVSMRHPDGDKIIVALGEDRHWIYFSVRDDQDNGTIIDFVQKRQTRSLGETRKLLRSWLDGSLPHPSPSLFVHNVAVSTKDRQTVISSLSVMKNAVDHPYLESRAVGKRIFGDRRFLGRIKIDLHGNAIFPHFDETGFCGYEIKNIGFTGFSPGGEKGLWISNISSKDTRMIVVESAIDALSFHALHGSPENRYMSTAGAWSPKTSFLLRRAAETLPGSEVVLAFDNDDEGRKFEDRSREIFQGTEKNLIVLIPTAKDWNDDLRVYVSSLRRNNVKEID